MHPNFWKYFAIVSIAATCVATIVTWLLWPSSSTESETRNFTQKNEVVEEKVEKEPIIPGKDRLTLLAAGDIMLDRTMLLLAQKNNDFGYAFQMISSTLSQADLRVANLEGPITTNKSISNGEGGARFSFTFSPKVTSSLKTNFDVVSLANNHTTNFGFEGLEQTHEFLDSAGIGWFGDPNNRRGEKISEIMEKNGIKIGLVGYHQLVETGFENVITEVKKIRPHVDVVIAYPHWGIEYVTHTPSMLQKKEGHALIDAGVDIVIGAHPHVIQPIEMYQGKPIFYSLGNFVFDQYFSLETMQGLLLNILLEKTTASVEAEIRLMPIHISRESQPALTGTIERDSILASVARASIGDRFFIESIEKGVLAVSIFKDDTKTVMPMK